MPNTSARHLALAVSLATLLAACGGAAPPTVASGSGGAAAGTPTAPAPVHDAPPSHAPSRTVPSAAAPPPPTAVATDEPPTVAAPDPDHGFFRGPSAEPAALAESPVVAIGELESLLSECSGLGGLHAIYRVSSQSSGHPVRLAHGGGHGVRRLAGTTEDLAFAGRRQIAPGRWFVLGLVPTARVDEDHDRNPDSGLAGWCLHEMPRTQAIVLSAVPVASRAAAEALVGAELARRAAATSSPPSGR
ncbi:MAG: hypothetical protein IT373_31995 [Polyangiaceae bacterium]|nr:hypothetical protein [Polyangiaceae bacterium]